MGAAPHRPLCDKRRQEPVDRDLAHADSTGLVGGAGASFCNLASRSRARHSPAACLHNAPGDGPLEVRYQHDPPSDLSALKRARGLSRTCSTFAPGRLRAIGAPRATYATIRPRNMVRRRQTRQPRADHGVVRPAGRGAARLVAVIPERGSQQRPHGVGGHAARPRRGGPAAGGAIRCSGGASPAPASPECPTRQPARPAALHRGHQRGSGGAGWHSTTAANRVVGMARS